MKKMMSKLAITLSIIISLPLNCFSWGSQIVNAGGYPAGDPIMGAVIYGGLANWVQCFNTGPCAYAPIALPTYGPNYFYSGYQAQQIPPYTSFNVDNWGWSFDQNMFANNASEMAILSTAPFNDTGQIRWIWGRGKSWRPDGTVFANGTFPQWTIDMNAIFYPDNTYYSYTTNQTIGWYPYTRLTNGGWNFRVWDHPGITDLYYHIRSDGNYIDSSLYYVNFTSGFYVNGQTAAPSIGYALKVLLRQAPGCASALNGNIAWVWGVIAIPDWANPPVGLTLP